MRETNRNFDCFNLPPNEYAGLVLTCCQNRREELVRLFNILFSGETNLKQKLAIIAVGSDGKEERHPQSKTELVVLYQNGDDKNFPIKANLILENINDSTLLINEIRNINDPNQILSFYSNDSNCVYPDRILNSILIWGNPEIYQKARRKVVSEITENSPQGKRIKEALRKQLSTYRKTTESGQYRDQTVYDNVNQYYFESDDPKQIRFGFKMGPLRAVQRQLDRLTIVAFKEGKITLNDIEKLPTNTVSRIEFLALIGLIDKNFAQQLIEAYLWFLREYHRIQEKFKQSDRKQVVSLPYNREEFDRHIEIIKSFIN